MSGSLRRLAGENSSSSFIPIHAPEFKSLKYTEMCEIFVSSGCFVFS